MIPFAIIAYIKDPELKNLSREYLNKNLQEAFIVANDALDDYLPIDAMLDYHNFDLSDDQLMAYFKTAFDMVISPSLRITIKPIYCYMIYEVIDWWVTIHEDSEIPMAPLDDKIRKKAEEYFTNPDEFRTFIEHITNMELYNEILFDDWDFLSPMVEDMTQVFLYHRPFFDLVFPDINLDDYLPLMPKDIKELYIEYREREKADGEQTNKTIDYLTLSDDIVRICETIQSRAYMRDFSEDQHNDTIRDILKEKDYIVRDQTRTGESGSGKSTGEADIQVFYEGVPCSIIESLILNGLEKKYLSEHLRKIYSYDTRGNFANYIISFVKVKDFSGFWDKYQSFISSFDFGLETVKEISPISFRNGTEIKCAINILNRSGHPTCLFHISVHLN